ncbi:histidinol dehydrogenase [Azotosporobacter soli]|uniref:histidinol dehydrogenase n=1 Tax=Azotosporobacter soli TaxID=3055040 RepID=UPI0031FF43AB
MKLYKTCEFERTKLEALLAKPAFDEVRLGKKAQDKLQSLFGESLTAVQAVERIVSEVRCGGDAAVLSFTERIDGITFATSDWRVSESEVADAYEKADPKVIASLRKAIANVKRFHEEQRPKSWLTEREKGAMLGQKVSPIGRVGIYVPGGTASYPSSVIMNAIPAMVAGVEEIIMAVPPGPGGKINDYVLIAAKESGVDRIFKMGGAQAIAALAFGTESVPRVDKITGPGNLFVTLAKKAVYGHCDIDMLAGPSEILIVADDSADACYVAADLLSQAEHDVLAGSILITDSLRLAKEVLLELERQLELLPRKEMAKQSLENNGLVLVVDNIEEAMELANLAAPEHLEILVADPWSQLSAVKNAGAVFLGPYSPEPLGDYWAGPNHVLPTGGTARFYSVLNVETFMKKTSIIAYTQAALAEVSDDIIRLAEAEGLTAHANAVRVRRERDV